MDRVLGKKGEKRIQGEKKNKNLRRDSRLPGYPHLFIDLRMIECD